MQRSLGREIEKVAVALVARHGAQVRATARRYAATPEDAEDAYQRGLEILLTKAPTTSEADLVPWLKTVVKHEAFALRRHRERHAPVTDDGELGERGTPPAATHEQAERYEDLRQGAEALAQLKSQEIRALRLRAEGYSYAEICEITGWSYTKANRCLTEGRRALSIRLAGIQGGIECATLAPLLSAVAGDDASADQVGLLRGTWTPVSVAARGSGRCAPRGGARDRRRRRCPGKHEAAAAIARMGSRGRISRRGASTAHAADPLRRPDRRPLRRR
jgi:RNA polymerase sigma factor (sigma-70 family)